MSKDTFEELCAELDSSDPDTREWAVFELGKLGEKRVVPVLIKMLNDPHEWVREKAVIALRNLKAREARKSLKKMLKTESNERVISTIRQTLSQLNSKK